MKKTTQARPGSGFRSGLTPRLKPSPVAARKARLAELAGATGEPFAGDTVLADFIGSVLDVSPFLRGLVLDDPARFAAILEADPDQRLRRLLAQTARAWRGADETALMQALRRAREEIALLAGLADLGGLWDLSKVTGALTGFADAAVGAAARFILSEAHKEGRLAVPDLTKPDVGSGWIILGMGKFGAGELNYSSDIDLIVLFDPAVARLGPDREPVREFVHLTRRLVHILQDRTSDGYVFRTDLRLRPDPGATSIAMSTDAALQYYESLGQNWERAALIKARPVAGDVAAGDAFLAELTPYIWRKYLDYAAIADIHSIKRQIHDHRGHEEIAVAGHNIKLGRGGIREIEFFVQTQQLIAGGRNPVLRGRRTLDMLAALADGDWIDRETCNDLTAAYERLRTVEHCLQMVADEQTHTLPKSDEDLAVICRMAGYRRLEDFSRALRETMGAVQDHYGALFERAPSLTSALGSLVFTGDTDDPATLDTLLRLGYRNPAGITSTVRAWHFGRYPSMRSATARERLTEFVPALIEMLSKTDNADQAFLAFDRFLARLPAGVQLFSLLKSNPWLLGLLATMLATAPRLADTVTRQPHVLDALIEPAFFGRVPGREVLTERLATSFAEASDYEDILNRARIFGQEHTFLIGVRVLAGTIGARQAGFAYADLAEVIVSALFEAVREEFERAHGRLPKGRAAILALGKLGGREMTAASDLDLILLYDLDDRASASDGPRPLPGAQYYMRLTQRLVAALSAPTAEGTLYQVDFRLRPSGNSGPLATHVDAFMAYQGGEAWTWEHMALTRARPIAGDAGLGAAAAKAIAKVLRRRRDRDKLIADVRDMRATIESEKGGEGAWDLKQAPGGLVDIEFIAQYLQLAAGHDHPAILSPETEVALTAAAKARLLPAAEAEILLPALKLYQALTQVLRLCVDGLFEPEAASRGLRDLLARSGELPDFATLDRHVADTEAAVRAAFERLIGSVG